MKAEDEDARGQAADWHIALHENPDDAALLAAFEAWRCADDGHRRALEAMTTTVAAIRAIPETIVPPRAGLSIAAIDTAGVGRQAGRRAIGYRHIAGAAIAAGVAFVAVPILQLHLAAEYVSTSGELRTVRLDDGSQVILGADSAVKIDYTARRRSVALLAGQAYFDVAHESTRPFHVIARDMRTTVLGIAFDVRMIGDSTSLSVARGRVRVENDAVVPHLRRDFTIGQSITFDHGSVQVESENPVWSVAGDLGAFCCATAQSRRLSKRCVPGSGKNFTDGQQDWRSTADRLL